MKPHRQSALLAIAVLLSGAAVVQQRSRTEARHEALSARALTTLDRLERGLRERATPRPTLDGTALLDGSAFEAYAEGIEATRDLVGGDHDAAALLCGTACRDASDGQVEARAALLADPAAARVLAAIRRGAHSGRAPLPREWYSGEAPLERTLLAVQVVLADVHHCLERGRSADGTDRLLDLLQFGADLAEAPLGLAEALGFFALDQCDLEALHASHGINAPSGADLDRLATAMAAVEARLHVPSGALEGELLVGRRALSAAGPETGTEHAAFVLVHARRFERLREAATESDDAWRTAARDLQATLDAEVGPIATAYRALRPLGAMEFRVATRDRLRATAIALNLARGRAADELPDDGAFAPTGAQFEFLRSPESVEVRCASGTERAHVVIPSGS